MFFVCFCIRACASACCARVFACVCVGWRPQRVISESLGPILAEIDVAIEGSDALAADLHAAMDLNHDGLVQKAEFFSTFDQCIANVRGALLSLHLCGRPPPN